MSLTLSTDAVSAPFALLEVGSYPAKGGEVTEDHIDRMVENFGRGKARGDEPPVDRDHSFVEGRGSRAAGWIKELWRDGKKLMARVAWTDRARQEIAAGEYRRVSAEVDLGWTDEHGEKWGPTLLAATLTNRPHLRSLAPVALDDRRQRAVELRSFLDAIDRGEVVIMDDRGGLSAIDRVPAPDDADALHAATEARLAENPGEDYVTALTAVRREAQEAHDIAELASRDDVDPQSLRAHERALVIARERGITYEEAAPIAFEEVNAC